MEVAEDYVSIHQAEEYKGKGNELFKGTFTFLRIKLIEISGKVRCCS